MSRLLRQLNLDQQDLFRSPAEILEDAYYIQAGRIAYSLEESVEAAVEGDQAAE